MTEGWQRMKGELSSLGQMSLEGLRVIGEGNLVRLNFVLSTSGEDRLAL